MVNGRFFISFEGIDGAGKTSVIDYLVTHYSNRGVEFTLMPEFPSQLSGSIIADSLKENLFIAKTFPSGPIPAFFYMLYSRVLCFQEIQNPRGIILADRYLITMAMYQGYFVYENEKDFDFEKVYESLVNLFDILKLPLPDAVLVFDAPLEELVRRLELREKRRISAREIEILITFQNVYHRISGSPGVNISLIDTSGPIEEIAEKVFEFLLRYQEDNN